MSTSFTIFVVELFCFNEKTKKIMIIVVLWLLSMLYG